MPYPITPAEIEEKYRNGAEIPATILTKDEQYLAGIEVEHFIRDNKIIFDSDKQRAFYYSYLISAFWIDAGFRTYITDTILENTNL